MMRSKQPHPIPKPFEILDSPMRRLSHMWFNFSIKMCGWRNLSPTSGNWEITCVRREAMKPFEASPKNWVYQPLRSNVLSEQSRM